MTQPDRLRLAVFIDFDNIEIGVKNSLNATFDVGLVLEALKERGEVVSKMAYSDWQRAGGYSRALTQHAIRMVQRNMTPGGDKNGADINLALDALEMAFTHPHINAFAIVGGDSDFISLVEKLKQYDRKVFVVGGRQFTSAVMQRNCHEFIAYENLASTGSSGAGRRAAGPQPRAERASLEQVVPLVKRAMKVLSERDVEPQLGLFKSTLLQLDSTFSERTYGAGSFRDFAQKLEKAGVLTVEHTPSGWIVGPANGSVSADALPVPDEGEAPASTTEASAAPAAAPASAAAPGPADEGTRPAQLGQAADGVRELGAILAAGNVRRWPLYLRNVKQVIRQTRPSFDERAYGFANLTDLLRAAHRDNVVRVDRDRQGVVRIFQGSAAPAAAPSVSTGPEIYDVENDPSVAAALARAHGIELPPEPAEQDEPAATPDPVAAHGEPVTDEPEAAAADPETGGEASAPAGRRRAGKRAATARPAAATPRRPRRAPAKKTSGRS
ncbi:MAG TPA: NYN domain-containing protein [Vicinamibacterales bacterium]|nr:NYN domain-containing protein [Vicinamibacterales bacterium]